ncbi:MAG: twin-arginine translocase TatA/TatE family subunit, partial [Flavobacteriales bacterium]
PRMRNGTSYFWPPMGFPLIFDISGGELMVILLFILLFFGAKGVPDIARTLGRTMRQIRDASNEVQREIQKGASEVKRGYEQERRSITLDPPQNTAPVAPAASPEAGPVADPPPAEA